MDIYTPNDKMPYVETDIDGSFDEKDPYEIEDIIGNDEQKISEQLQEKEKQINIWKKKYNDLKYKYDKLQKQFKRKTSAITQQGEYINNTETYFEHKQRTQFQKEKKVLCGIIPWF